MPDAISLDQKLDLFSDTWSPRIIAELNGQHVKLAHLEGEFLWHAHEHEDELFFVARGRLRIDMRGASGEETSVELGPGELVVVPRGVEHRPVALPTASVMLFEPASTAHTGAVVSERTVADQPWI